MAGSVWDDISSRELRIAAKVARASGGLALAAAAEAWEVRAVMQEEREARLRDMGVPNG